MPQTIEEYRAQTADDHRRDAIRYAKIISLIDSKRLISFYKSLNRAEYCLIADDIHVTGKTLDAIIDQLP